MNKLMSELFELRGTLSKKVGLSIELIGLVVLIGVWSLVCYFELVHKTMLPSPWSVVTCFKELHFENYLVRNVGYSISLNLLGYLEAVAIAIPLGFLLGLFPVFRSLFSRYVNSVRFIPLTAVTGLFIAWFGIHENMKVQFLAFGIMVYLLPVVIQRIDEVENIYVHTIYTLGASKWQTFRYVFLPRVLSRLSDDIRTLVAISWTYIIVAELLNNNGGIGAMAYMSARLGRLDKVFAILLVIVLIGFIQDKFFSKLDKIIFPYKHK